MTENPNLLPNPHMLQPSFELIYDWVDPDELWVRVRSNGGLGHLDGVYCKINFTKLIEPEDNESYAIFEYATNFTGTYNGGADLVVLTETTLAFGVVNDTLIYKLKLFPNNVPALHARLPVAPKLEVTECDGVLLDRCYLNPNYPVRKLLEQTDLLTEQNIITIIKDALLRVQHLQQCPAEGECYYIRLLLDGKYTLQFYMADSNRDRIDDCGNLLKRLFNCKVEVRGTAGKSYNRVKLNGITLVSGDDGFYRVCKETPVDIHSHIFKL